jgi:ABC-type multidrug transport system ATPase subunit
MMPLVCKDIVCEFGGTRALDEVSLELAPKDFLAVVGENAAGKTTLLNAISGMCDARASKIEVFGVDLRGMAMHRRAGAGVVRSFEDSGVCDLLPAVDNVALGLRRGRLAERRRVARGLLEEVGLGAKLAAPGATLSLGERRRMELARVLARVQEAEDRCVVLLDEPFRGLDTDASRSIVELMKSHLVGRAPTVMIEHDLSVVDALATRVAYMANGRILDAVPEPRVRSAPHEPKIAADGQILLELSEVTAGYGSVEILRGVTLCVRAGDAVWLRGSNGAGKSTLLRVVMGTLRATAGEVRVLGERLDGGAARPVAGVGYAPQGGRLISALTVWEHLRLAERVAERRREKPALGPAFLAAFPELGLLLPKAAGSLSSGQRSLVSLATALTVEPRLLIADEPVAGLAPPLVDRVWRFLTDVWCSPSRATVIVEHADCMTFPARHVQLARGTLR